MKEIKKKVKGYLYFAKLFKMEGGGQLQEVNEVIFKSGKMSRKNASKTLSEKYPDYSIVIYDVKQKDTMYVMDLEKFMECAKEVIE